MRTVPLALAVALLIPAAPLDAGLDDEVPGARIPAFRERRYTMSGAARPLLFWIRRDNIGLARITWRKDPGGARGFEFLVGTDPARAPRGLNRWGFISEESLGTDGALLALMTGSHETSYDSEAANAARGSAAGDFRAILSTLDGGTVNWRLARVFTPEALTVHHVERAVGSVEEQSARTTVRHRAVPAGVRPGFLVAVADLLDTVVSAASLREQGSDVTAERVRYVFGEQTYELRVRRVDPLSQAVGGVPTPALRALFETRTLSTNERTEFTIVTGTGGEMAGVPLQIEWQPRWWLKVRLTLDGA